MLSFTDTYKEKETYDQFVGFKDLLNKPYCMQTYKNCEQDCKHQLVNIILVINWLILASIFMYIFVNTNIVWELFLVKGKYFSFILRVMPYWDYKMSKLQITSAS